MSRTSPELIAEYQRLYLEGDIDGVALVAADANRCSTCARFDDQMYLPSTLPPLPVPGCAASAGCRCRYEPNFTVVE